MDPGPGPVGNDLRRDSSTLGFGVAPDDPVATIGPMPDPIPGDGQPRQLVYRIDLPDDVAGGVFGDFASVWHTPNSFIVDFISIVSTRTAPPQTVEGATGPRQEVINGRVVSRVRIPPEQVFPLQKVLKEQGEMWLRERGISEPPADWLTGPSGGSGSTVDRGFEDGGTGPATPGDGVGTGGAEPPTSQG